MQCTKKITIIFVILIAIVLCTSASVFAVTNPEKYNPTKNPVSDEDAETAIKLIGKILATIRVVGVCISVVVLTVIGFKYMICSVSEKATYKENMVPYVVGCILLASATTIPSIVYDIASK